MCVCVYVCVCELTRISGNLPAQKMLVGITRICSKSPALRLLCWEQKRFST